jgi:hypothetical protein
MLTGTSRRRASGCAPGRFLGLSRAIEIDDHRDTACSSHTLLLGAAVRIHEIAPGLSRRVDCPPVFVAALVRVGHSSDLPVRGAAIVADPTGLPQ